MQLIQSLPSATATTLLRDWEIWARDKQIAPAWSWVLWLVLAGRGFGKTRCGAEWLRQRVESGKARHVIIAGATADDLRDIMIEGESGLLAVSSPHCMPTYLAHKSQVVWPNGAKALCISAEKPDRFRGKQSDTLWADELASWRYEESWDQLQFGFRLGVPQGIITTTPRPTPIVKALLARAGQDVAVTRGTTYENRANLAKPFFDAIIRRYEGTRLGRQELEAEILDDNPGALWKRGDIDGPRVQQAPELVRVVVAIDPAVTANEDSDETGIVAAGLGVDGHAYVLGDVSGIYSPDGWAKEAIKLYRSLQADRVVAEVNNGGDLVEANLRTVADRYEKTRHIAYRQVRASRGKAIRAEPIAALYEQRRVHHVGSLAKLEDELCGWDPTVSRWSPNRLDALVWALTDLMLGTAEAPRKPAAVADFHSRLEGDSGW